MHKFLFRFLEAVLCLLILSLSVVGICEHDAALFCKVFVLVICLGFACLGDVLVNEK